MHSAHLQAKVSKYERFDEHIFKDNTDIACTQNHDRWMKTYFKDDKDMARTQNQDRRMNKIRDRQTDGQGDYYRASTDLL